MMTAASSPSKNSGGKEAGRVSVVRMVVVGPPGAGCSSLVRRFVSDTFDEQPAAPVSGARFHSKMLLAPQHGMLRFKVWDVPRGDELLLPVYAAGASVVLVCFDLSCPQSLRGAAELLRRLGGGPLAVLVGCKADAIEPGTPRAGQAMDEAAAAALAHSCSFFAATSAREGARGSPVMAVFVSAATARARPPAWIPDGERSCCAACEQRFSAVLRRHHCRACGDVFCAECTAERRPVPRFGFDVPVRVCRDCCDVLAAQAAQQ